jgi:hypothetical protein
MRKHNGVNHSMTMPARARRKRVIERLENQLQSGFKRVSIKDDSGKSTDSRVKLTDSEVTRIQKEIEVLKTRC